MTDDGAALLDYHRRSELRPDAAQLTVEPWNRPRPFKLYEGLAALPLSRIGLASGTDEALAAPAGSRALDLRTLATLLHWSAGITRRRRLADGSVMQFRAASCTGALYHVELYVVCAALDGLPAGVYHYAPQNETLQRLRTGDHRAQLVEACAADAELADAPVALVLSSEFWRNAWRYGERSYRHAFWDAGTIIANLLALAEAHGLHTRLLTAFDDDAVNRLIGVDGMSEAALAVVALGSGAPSVQPAPTFETLAPRVVPSSPRPRLLPAIGAAHAASSLPNPAAVVSWRAAAEARVLSAAPASPPIQLPESPAWAEPVEAIIARRGSARRFAAGPIAGQALAAICRAAAATPHGDAWPHGAPICEPLLLVRAAADIAPGLYRVRCDATIARLATADELGDIARLAPDAERARGAAATVWWTADLETGVRPLGGRGYRAAQLEAGVALGRVYLAATAHGLGATGLTFFDEAARRFFAPWLPRRGVMLAAAVGVTWRPS